MKPNSAKRTACKTYYDYIHLILVFGKGLMFSKHIEQYMYYFNNYSKSKVWRDLRVLENDDIISINKYHNSNYIRLKKFALRYIAEQNNPFDYIESKDISSIKYSELLLRKSLFINQYVLTKMLNPSMSLEDFIYHLTHTTTLFAKSKDNAFIFQNLSYQPPNLKDEITNLNELKRLQNINLRTCSNYSLTKHSDFNINNMQSRNIFIVHLDEQKIVICLFDVYNNYTPQKLPAVIKEIYSYLFCILTDSKATTLNQQLIFKLVVAKNTTKDTLLASNATINSLLSLFSTEQISIIITSLNIDKTCFSHVNLLL